MSQNKMAGPKILVDQSDFRVVQVGDGNGLRRILEVEDGCDALGVLRWREFKLDNQRLRSVFGYLCRVVTERVQPQWQPIETAPKDGTRVLLFGPDRITTGHYDGVKGHEDRFPFGWRGAHEPTHWMALPDPPGAGAASPSGERQEEK